MRNGRAAMLILGTVMLGACANQDGAQGGAVPEVVMTEEPTTDDASAQEDEGEMRAEPTAEPAEGDVIVGSTNAPPGFVETHDGEQPYASMVEGDGTAADQLLQPSGLPTPPWRPVSPDGPWFVQTVCGVQMDPVEPRDAAATRWSWVENAQYLTSEVHLFDEAEAHHLTSQVADALEACEGYGVDAYGEEVEAGEGETQVSVEAEGSLVPGWTFWTERTEGTGMVRQNALRDVDGGWHWVSQVSYFGNELDPELLIRALGSDETGGRR